MKIATKNQFLPIMMAIITIGANQLLTASIKKLQVLVLPVERPSAEQLATVRTELTSSKTKFYNIAHQFTKAFSLILATILGLNFIIAVATAVLPLVETVATITSLAAFATIGTATLYLGPKFVRLQLEDMLAQELSSRAKIVMIKDKSGEEPEPGVDHDLQFANEAAALTARLAIEDKPRTGSTVEVDEFLLVPPTGGRQSPSNSMG